MVIASRGVQSRAQEPVSPCWSRGCMRGVGSRVGQGQTASDESADWGQARMLGLNTKMTRLMDPLPQPARFSRGLAVLGALGVLSWLAGCSVLVDANRPQCSTNADCTSRGPEFAGAVCKSGWCEVASNMVDPKSDPKWICDAAQPTDVLGYKLTMPLTDAINSSKVL